LRDADASVESMDNVGLMQLHLAAENRHLLVIKTLAEFGAKVSSIDPDSSTRCIEQLAGVIHMLSESWLISVLKYRLVTRPLREARKSGHVNAVKVLVERAANVSTRSDKGKTPRGHASRNNELLALIHERTDVMTENHFATTKLRPNSKRAQKPENTKGSCRESEMMGGKL
jgi:ankyrin repeat protein